MPVISSKDLDKQMSQGVDLASVSQRHPGATEGAMEAMIRPRGGEVEGDALRNLRGTPVYDPSEIPGRGFYGSSTVISVNDAPPLDVGLEPKKMPIPGQEVAVDAQPAPVPAPAPTRALTAVEMMAKFGLKAKP